MISLNINGRIVQAKEGEYLLSILRKEKIEVPTLCHHGAVEPSGACRMCIVEVTKPEWNGWSDYVTSCLYPAVDGLIINTHSSKVIELRKSIIDLYLARHPKSPEIKEMAAQFGVIQTQFETVVDGDNCILCGLCTRICDTMGFSAISTVGRGHGKEVAPPLDMQPPDCVGCLSCAKNCPTNFIEYAFKSGKVTIWNKKFDLLKCSECKKETITKEFAEYLSENRNIPFEYFEKCDECRRRELTKTMGRITNWEREARS